MTLHIKFTRLRCMPGKTVQFSHLLFGSIFFYFTDKQVAVNTMLELLDQCRVSVRWNGENTFPAIYLISLDKSRCVKQVLIFLVSIDPSYKLRYNPQI